MKKKIVERKPTNTPPTEMNAKSSNEEMQMN